MSKVKKSKEVVKVILIFALVFLLVPIIVFSIFYSINSDFKKAANELLRNSPGVIGEYFGKFPTERERIDKEYFLANYYLSLKEENAADKLYIIKDSDEELYDNIIKKMNSISSNKTQSVVKLVRNIELRKDLLYTLYDEIIDEQESILVEDAKRIEDLDLILAIKEVEMLVNQGINKDNLGRILANIDEEKASEIIYYMNPNLQNIVLSSIEENHRNNINSILMQMEQNEEDLNRRSKIYEAMDIDRAIKEIGNDETYSINELAKIYFGLSIKRTSDILLNCEDEFVNQIIKEMEAIENLYGLEESKTVKIMEAINFKKQYISKINELVELYEKMEAADILEIVEEMYNNNESVSLLEIDENPIYIISDSTIIIDVLRNMKKQKVAQVLSIMDSNDAAIITRELAITE